MLKKIFILVITIFTLTMGLLIYSRFISTKGLITKEYIVTNNKLPESFNNLKIVHFSDILYNKNSNKKDIDKIVKEINIIEPDLVIFTGDLINKNYKISAKDKQYLIDIFNSIDPKYGKYAILGDNDYSDITTIKDIYLNSNIHILDNEYDIIYNDNNDSIFLGGISSYNKKESDIDKIMTFFNDNQDINYKILLLHEPDYIDNIIPKYNINLILGGHSLNGQINIPIIKDIFLQKGSKKYYKNYYKLENTDIYISSGIGTYKSNFRLNNKPSINLYKLNNSN